MKRKSRIKTKKKTKKLEKAERPIESPDFGLSNTIQPIIDFSTLLGETIKPLYEVQLTLNEPLSSL